MTNRDKLTKTESLSAELIGAEWSEDEADDPTLVSEVKGRMRVMVSRAVVIYLVLFLGLGIVMSAAGANPLVNGGLMPKILLAFVGLGLLIALGNTLTDLMRAHGWNLLRLAPKPRDPAIEKEIIE
jgi:hypothetical protein